jgi:hypothetical protein
MFGGRSDQPDQRTVWREMATLLGGELVEGKRQTADKILVSHGPWRVTTEIYVESNGKTSVTYTRVQAYFLGWRGLEVLVRRRNFLDRLWEGMGFGTRLPLSPALLERYVVKGKPPGRVPSLFAGQELHAAIQSAESLRLQVKRPSRKMRKRYGVDVGLVDVRTSGIVRDLGRLAGLIRATTDTLDALHRVGEARADALPEA